MQNITKTRISLHWKEENTSQDMQSESAAEVAGVDAHGSTVVAAAAVATTATAQHDVVDTSVAVETGEEGTAGWHHVQVCVWVYGCVYFCGCMCVCMDVCVCMPARVFVHCMHIYIVIIYPIQVAVVGMTKESVLAAEMYTRKEVEIEVLRAHMYPSPQTSLPPQPRLYTDQRFYCFVGYWGKHAHRLSLFLAHTQT